MTPIDQPNNGIRIILLVRFGPSSYEKLIVLSPDRQHRRLAIPEVLLERGVECYVGFVIEEQVELDVGVSGTR